MSTNPTAYLAQPDLRANPLASEQRSDDLSERFITERDRAILYLSPIHRLPTEILTIIFNLATDAQWDIASSDFPWCPLLVCRSWYNIAIHTPSLWTSTFLVDGASSVVRTRLPLVLTRSGRLPISFSIANIGSHMKDDDSVNFTGFELLSKHVGRWKHASFRRCFNAFDWARVSKGVSFACLETMVISHLQDVERRDFAFFAPVAPRLRKLTVVGGNFDMHLAPFAKELVCKRVSLGAQAHFLSRAPHRAEIFTSTESLPWPSTHSFRHPNLTRVSVNAASFMLLATASMPNLQHLAVTLGLINKQHLNIITRLVQRAQVRLCSFSLTLTRPYEDLDFPEDFASSLVANIPTLHELSISFSDEDCYNQWDPRSAIEVLQYLLSRLAVYRVHPLNTLRIAFFVDAPLSSSSFDDNLIFAVPSLSSEDANLFWTHLKHFRMAVKVKGGEGCIDAEDMAQTWKVKTMQTLANSPLLHGVQLEVVYECRRHWKS
ncbi:hypothetical protein CPB85DRAFT_274517 [Mucidula mucida]|nr:hypothetical protein CPB85DRAFT_274517 [Mucidula mucida]